MRSALPPMMMLFVAACYSPPIAPATPSAWQISGDNQAGVPGYRLPSPIGVRVLDADGRPIVGDTITFTPSDPNGYVEPTTAVVTDSTGSASVFWRLGSTLGSQTLRAESRLPGVSAASIVATSRSNYAASIDGGSSGLCMVDAERRLGCWIPPRLRTVDADTRLIQVNSAARFAAVTMIKPDGVAASGCALADSGRPWCFTLDVAGGVVGLSELAGVYPGFAQLTSGGTNGGSSYCGLTALGEAWCWGKNADGQIGDGTFTDRTNPVPVTTSTRFAQLDIGGSTVCGLSALGEVWCWGANFALQTGSTTSGLRTTTPNRVNTALRFLRVRTLTYSATSCGVLPEGGLSCWGQVAGALATCIGACAPATPTPVAVPSVPDPIDVAEEFGLTVVLDNHSGMQFTGPLPNITDMELSYPTRPALPTGLITEIRLSHGSGFVCGTAAVGGATLCPSTDGFVGVRTNHTVLFWPPVVGVPFP